VSFWEQKKVLVTGAGGFIGSHLVETLVQEGAVVSALVHYNSRNDWGNLEYFNSDILDEIDVIPGDLIDPFIVEKAVKGSEIVFHLGALIAIPYSYIAPWQFVSTNIRGTLNVLEACRKYRVKKLIHTSTSEVYGTAKYTPIDEDHPFQPQSPYSASKIGADQMAMSYHNSYNLPVTVIRPFNTYGPRQSARAVIPTIISQALKNKKIKLGALDPIRDLTYVDDTVNGFLSIAQSDEALGEVINIGNDKGISILDLTHLILRIMDKGNLEIICEEKRIRPEKSEVYKLICNSQKARKLFSWEPKYTLRYGLEKTISWTERNIQRMKTRIYNI
jgi:NAD dependent epimerase/dehydratase